MRGVKEMSNQDQNSLKKQQQQKDLHCLSMKQHHKHDQNNTHKKEETK